MRVYISILESAYYISKPWVLWLCYGSTLIACIVVVVLVDK